MTLTLTAVCAFLIIRVSLRIIKAEKNVKHLGNLVDSYKDEILIKLKDQDLEILDLIGEGTFAEVYRCNCKHC